MAKDFVLARFSGDTAETRTSNARSTSAESALFWLEA